jgi:hypothetical protein
MSTFQTMYAQALYRDLVRLSGLADYEDQARQRILARMVDTVNEAVRDEVKSASLVDQIIKMDVDLDPEDLADSIHQLIEVHFVAFTPGAVS